MDWQDRRHRKQLPVDEFLDDLMALTKRERVVVVSTDRRTGVSTRIPQALLLAHPGTRVRVSMPRRLQVMAAGMRMLAELGGERRGSVNWQTGVARKRSHEWNARITLTTHKSMIHRIRDDAGLLPEGWFLMDDAHVRSSEGTLLLGFLRAGIERSVQSSIIVQTDEEHAEAFAEYFGKAPVFRISRKQEDVRDGVVSEACGLFGSANALLTSFVRGGLPSGSVMLLCHGREDASALAGRIRRYVETEKFSDRVRVIDAHSMVAHEQWEQISQPTVHDTIRFICGTEILRTGATPPDLLGIVDALVIRRLQSDDGVEWSVRNLPLSRDEARWTRAMLTDASGRFYLTVGRAWETLDPDDQRADMPTMTETVLEAAAAGTRIGEIALLHTPEPARVKNAVEYLQAVDALDQEDGSVTHIGRRMLEFPLDPPLSRVLVAAAEREVLPEAMLAVAFLQIGGIFSGGQEAVRDGVMYSEEAAKMLFSSSHNRPHWFVRTGSGYRIDAKNIHRPRDAARSMERTVRATFARMSGNDFVGSIRAYRAFKAQERVVRTDERLLRQWCRERFLNYDRIRLADALVERIRVEAEDMMPLHHLPECDVGFSAADLTKSLIAGLPYRLARREKGGTWKDRLGEFLLSYASCCPRNAPLLLTGGMVLAQMHSDDAHKRGVRICQFAAPVQSEWIRETFSAHLECRRSFAMRYDPVTDQVTEQETDHLFGLPIESRMVVVTDSERAVSAIAQWMVEHPDQARQKRLTSVLEKNRQWALAHGVEEDELYAFYETCLRGKRGLANFENPAVLQWPGMIDRTPAAPVKVGTEDIRIGNRAYRLTRRGGRFTVVFDDAFIEEGLWKQLSSNACHAPSGGTLEMAVRSRHLDYRRIRADHPIALMQQIRQCLHEKRIAEMPMPNIPLPDLDDPQADFPPVLEYRCGEDALDGSPLFAYVTFGLVKDADPIDPFLRPVVYLHRPLAEALRTSLQRDLPVLRDRWRSRQALVRLHDAAGDLQRRLRAWIDQNGEDERIPLAQRARARTVSQEPLAHSSAWLETWIRRMRAFYVYLHDLTARTSVVPDTPSVG